MKPAVRGLFNEYLIPMQPRDCRTRIRINWRYAFAAVNANEAIKISPPCMLCYSSWTFYMFSVPSLLKNVSDLKLYQKRLSDVDGNLQEFKVYQLKSVLQSIMNHKHIIIKY